MCRTAHSFHASARHARRLSQLQGCARRGAAPLSTAVPRTVPHLTAPKLGHASHRRHVRDVAEQLRQSGMLKISLGFPDSDSEYLEQLILNLHRHHGHRLPISHSATRGWFWDVRPSTTAFQTANHRARSETMEEFPWHSDCSYEELPPRYFALQVLQHDRLGGGTLSVMNVQRLSESLSQATRASLMRPEYRIAVPSEFIKEPATRSIRGSLLAADEEGRCSMMRFRRDLLTPLTARASTALDELNLALQNVEAHSPSTVHLTAGALPERSVILIDNRRWLHARNEVRDPARHLRRVRWDAVPFPSVPN